MMLSLTHPSRAMIGGLCFLVAAAGPAAAGGGFHRPVGYAVKKSTGCAILSTPNSQNTCGGDHAAITANVVKNALQTRAGGDDEGSSKSKANDFVKIGNAGNVLVIALSVALLVYTIKKAHPPLDPAYIENGFCISLPDSEIFNSHMLSLYVDLILTIALIAFRTNEKDAFVKLKLNEYFLSTMKIASVAGHGSAHFGLSVMKFFDKGQDLNSTWVAALISGVMFATGLINEGILSWLKEKIGIIESSIDDTKNQVKFLNKVAAPFLAPVALALGGFNTVIGEDKNLVGQLIFGGAAFMFFLAGNPPGVPGFWPVVAAILLTIISSKALPPGDSEATIGIGFVLIFTSAYVYSSAAQMLLWDDKKKEEVTTLTYAISAWVSGLLTTLVGWAIALSCSSLKKLGGHVLYDLSIPVSYFILFYLTKYFHSKMEL